MDRDYFIITVYCLVCEHYRVIAADYPLRRGGFAPDLTDEEVITMEICGEYFKLACDTDLFAYFHTHSHHFFPRLQERTRCVRHAADLWQIKAVIQQQLIQVCGYTRSRRDHCFKPEADYGHCAAKQLDYYGVKFGRARRAQWDDHALFATPSPSPRYSPAGYAGRRVCGRRARG